MGNKKCCKTSDHYTNLNFSTVHCLDIPRITLKNLTILINSYKCKGDEFLFRLKFMTFFLAYLRLHQKSIDLVVTTKAVC